MKRRRLLSNVVFTDLSMNALLSFLMLFILAFIMMNPERPIEQDPVIETEGKYMIVMSWPDGSPDDVDLYVLDPVGNVAYFQDRDVGLMHLDHDDLGGRSDTVNTGSDTIRVEKNEERIVIRGVVPGEYAVNIHLYRKESDEPVPVTITLYRLRGRDAEIVSKERVLKASGDEMTAFRFTLRADETVGEINEMPRRFVARIVTDDSAPTTPLSRRERHETP